jgi:hypothetical protein
LRLLALSDLCQVARRGSQRLGDVRPGQIGPVEPLGGQRVIARFVLDFAPLERDGDGRLRRLVRSREHLPGLVEPAEFAQDAGQMDPAGLAIGRDGVQLAGKLKRFAQFVLFFGQPSETCLGPFVPDLLRECRAECVGSQFALAAGCGDLSAGEPEDGPRRFDCWPSSRALSSAAEGLPRARSPSTTAIAASVGCAPKSISRANSAGSSGFSASNAAVSRASCSRRSVAGSSFMAAAVTASRHRWESCQWRAQRARNRSGR